MVRSHHVVWLLLKKRGGGGGGGVVVFCYAGIVLTGGAMLGVL